MSPKVQGFIGGIEHTEDALKRGALRVAVAADDEMLMEMLWNLMDLIGGTGKSDRSHPGQLLSGKRTPLLYILINHNSVLITKNFEFWLNPINLKLSTNTSNCTK